jgi:hypothetical protein
VVSRSTYSFVSKTSSCSSKNPAIGSSSTSETPLFRPSNETPSLWAAAIVSTNRPAQLTGARVAALGRLRRRRARRGCLLSFGHLRSFHPALRPIAVCIAIRLDRFDSRLLPGRIGSDAEAVAGQQQAGLCDSTVALLLPRSKERAQKVVTGAAGASTGASLALELFASHQKARDLAPQQKTPRRGGGALLGLLQGGEICISIYVWIRGR